MYEKAGSYSRQYEVDFKCLSEYVISKYIK